VQLLKRRNHGLASKVHMKFHSYTLISLGHWLLALVALESWRLGVNGSFVKCQY